MLGIKNQDSRELQPKFIRFNSQFLRHWIVSFMSRKTVQKKKNYNFDIKIQQFRHYSLKKNYNFDINKGEKWNPSQANPHMREKPLNFKRHSKARELLYYKL